MQLIEHHVKKAWLDAIAELKDKGMIDEGLMEYASKQSNIDQMMQEMQESGEAQQAQQAQQQAQQAQNAPQPAQAQVPQAQGGGVPAVQGGGVPSNTKDKYAPPKLLKMVSLALLLKRMDEENVQSIWKDLIKMLREQ